MNFFDGNGTSIRSGNEINTLKKQLKALQEQTDALSVAISDLEDTVAENKGESEQADLALGENISINAGNISSLSENLENYKTSQAEITENQITRSSEYVESPLGRFVNLEVSGHITGGDFDDVKDDITSLQNALEETNGNVQTNADNIETLNNKQSVIEQKVDTILEQGEIPITTDEVQLGNALISSCGNIYYGHADIPQDDDLRPVVGTIIRVDNKSRLILQSDSVGYKVAEIVAENYEQSVSDIQQDIQTFISRVSNQAYLNTSLLGIKDRIILHSSKATLEQYSDTVKSLNAGIVENISFFTNDNVNTFTYNDQLDYLYIITVDKVFKYENGTLTDVTDTVTTIPANAPYLGGSLIYECLYKNYFVLNNTSYELSSNQNSIFNHEADSDLLTKFKYWYLQGE